MLKVFHRVVFLPLLLAAAFPHAGFSFAQSLTAPSATSSSQTDGAASPSSQLSSTSKLPRGKKLILKDGSFQLVREYQIQGDRVRYYSLDSSQWEEMPASLVDWDATRKVEAAEIQQTNELVQKIDKQEAAQRVTGMDVDASFEAAPGVFLPAGAGLFEFDGHTIRPLTEANQDESIDKKRIVEKILSPVPLVPTRQTIWIGGPRSRFRVKNNQPEFYMRTTDGHEPELELIRIRVHGDRREVENIDMLFGETKTDMKVLPMLRWEMAPGLCRFIVTQPLESGEYGLVEMAKSDTPSFFIWDFGIDRNASAAPIAPPASTASSNKK